MKQEKKLIGVFDSGVGGLTVVKALKEELPNEQFCYLADSLNLPYGNKSPDALEKICLENIQFLMKQPLKALIIACNTASAHSFDSIKKRFNVPIFDVITPSVDEAVKKTEIKKIVVLGTDFTIQSKVYEKLIQARMPEVEVISIACPLLVSVIEENMIEHKLSKMLVNQYLSKLEDIDFDVVILGCTHYPLLHQIIRQELPEHVEIIDSGQCSVQKLKQYLEKNNMLEKKKSNVKSQFFVSGNPESFNEVSSSVLQQDIQSQKRII